MGNNILYKALPCVNKDDPHHGSVIALVEVKAALHANTLLSFQLPKYQLTCMSCYCRVREKEKERKKEREMEGIFFANVSS